MKDIQTLMMKSLTICLMLLCGIHVQAYNTTTDSKLAGTIVTSGSATTAKNAFDGDITTSFTASNDKMEWVGLDLGAQYVITRVGFVPRLTSSGSYSSSYAEQTVLSLFEGANSPDFMDAVPLYLISEAPTTATFRYVDVNVSRGFRYVRYVGGAGSYCNIGELEFYGHEGEGDDSHFYQITNLPTLSIHVKDNVVPQNRGEDFESNSLLIYNDGAKVQEYPIEFRVRGNYSATPENKAYRIKYNDGSSHHPMKGSDNEAPVKAKKWVLINSWRDKTLMRNPVAWEVSKRMNPNWTPWCQVVDLVMNGDYRGTYTLADHVDVHSGRIDITEMDADDIDGDSLTGGYYVEIDNNSGREPYHFSSSHGNPITVHDPDEDVMQPAMFNYIQTKWNEMEDKLFSSDYTDPTKGYQPYLDMESMLKYFLISEFNGNTDMLCQVFLYKDRYDDHFYTGPVWDAELALDDDSSIYPGNNRSDWTYTVRGTGNSINFYRRLLSDPAAMNRLQDMWAEIREDSAITSSNMSAMVDSLRKEVSASANLNFIRWPYLNQYISLTPAIRGTWDAEVDVVRDYVAGRVAWMDKKLGFNTLEQSSDGTYLISSGRDLITYYNLVKGGETTADAKLTADIDMSNFNDRFSPFGTYAKPYCATFDGGNHTISNLHMSGDDYISFLGVTGTGGKVKNLYFDSSCTFDGKDYVSAFVSYARTGALDITNCGTAATVTASGIYAAGLVGYARKLATITMTNCYNSGNITANNYAAGLVGWSLGKVTVTNAYNSGTLTGVEEGKQFAYSELSITLTNCYDLGSGQVTTITAQQVASGELCYQLNYYGGTQLWRQNIDNGRARDGHPVPKSSSGIVYKTDAGHYTNINSNAQTYRYYKLVFNTLKGGSGAFQLSEFDLLDECSNEVDALEIYNCNVSPFSSDEGWDNMTDNDTSTKYCASFSSGLYMMFDAGKSIDIYGYRMYTGNDTQSYPERNPTGWALYGSNTYTEDAASTDWVLIDEQVDDNTLEATNFTPYDFMIPHALEGLKLNTHSTYLTMGDTLQLKATTSPESMASLVKLHWESTNDLVVKVDANGHVTANGTGEADIIVTAPDYGIYADTCHVVAIDESVGYRYYLLAINAVKVTGTIQLSEFDILDAKSNEVEALSLYSYTGSSVSNHPQTDLVDNSTATKYCGSFTEPVYLYFDASAPVAPSGYRMYTANDTQKFPSRNPVSWCLYGSNTPSTSPTDDCWILLDQRTNDETLQAVNYTPFTFALDYSSMIDGINEVDAESNVAGGIYDLSGRRVVLPSRGTNEGGTHIYIMNGKKTQMR